MTTFFRRVAFVFTIILAFQFYHPAFIRIYAGPPGEETQNAILQSKLAIEFHALPAGAIKAVLKDKMAFVTAGTAGLFIMDLQDPANLRQAAYLDLPEAVSLIGIYGSHLYLPALNNLYIVDITDPLHPTYICQTPMYSNEPLVGIATDSNHMFLARKKSIMVFSLTEPAKPMFISSFFPDTPDESFIISDIAVRGGTVYIAENEKGVGVYSFADVNNVAYKGRYNSSSGYCTDIDFFGNNAYLGIPDKNRMEILDISTVEKPVYSAEIKGIRSIICIDGNTAYAVNNLGYMSILNLSEYLQPMAAKKDEVAEDKNKKTAYVTIDDGPSRSITPLNLDTLKKYGVKATFFVLPRDGVDDLYKRIVDEGHVLGNHSYSHDYNYLYSSAENFKKDVVEARDFVYKKSGYTSTVFRFPGGTMGRSRDIIKTRAEILDGLGYKYFDWDVSTADTDPNLKNYGNEEYIVNLLADNVLKNTKDRKKLILLMHDSAGKIYSAKALPKIIEGLQKQGYVFDVLTNY